MSRWDAFKATLRELLRPAPHDEPLASAEQLELDTQARTEWVRSHRVEGG